MKFTTRESDLYVLPETTKERHQLQSFIEQSGICAVWSYSDIEGQEWHGKQFLDIPFGVCFKDDIIDFCKK